MVQEPLLCFSPKSMNSCQYGLLGCSTPSLLLSERIRSFSHLHQRELLIQFQHQAEPLFVYSFRDRTGQILQVRLCVCLQIQTSHWRVLKRHLWNLNVTTGALGLVASKPIWSQVREPPHLDLTCNPSSAAQFPGLFFCLFSNWVWNWECGSLKIPYKNPGESVDNGAVSCMWAKLSDGLHIDGLVFHSQWTYLFWGESETQSSTTSQSVWAAKAGLSLKSLSWGLYLANTSLLIFN